MAGIDKFDFDDDERTLSPTRRRASRIVGRRQLSYLWITAVVLLLYGSYMPFDFSFPPPDAVQRAHRIWSSWPFTPDGEVGRADILANVLLYIPLGLFAATRLRLGRVNRGVAFGVSLVHGFALTVAVEAVQFYLITRVCDAQDVLSNTLGTAIGAALGVTCGRRWWTLLRRSVRWRLRVTSLSPVCALLVLMLAADAFYPLLPTQDVSAVKNHVKTTLALFRDPLGPHLWHGYPIFHEWHHPWCHSWHHWLVCRVGLYAALAALMAGVSRRMGAGRYATGAVAAFGVAVVLELGKTFIETRYSNPGNVLMSGVGVIVGALLAARLAPGMTYRRKAWVAALAILVYMAYMATVPRPNEIGTERFRWDVSLLPLYDYCMRGGLEDVKLFLRSILLSASVIFSLAVAGVWSRLGLTERAWRGAIWMALFGLATMSAKLLFTIPGRTPSTTDAFCYAVGAAVGAWVYHRMHLRAYLGRPVNPDEIPEAVDVSEQRFRERI